MWSTGDKEKQNLARDRKRKLSYYSNIYVIEDPLNPENEQKTFLFKYGVKIFEKIDAALRPKFKRDKSIDAFDPWLGADFELKICLNDRKYWSYEQSTFSAPSPFLDAGEDESTGWPEFSKVYASMHNLNELISPENFKSNDELQKRLDVVLNNEESSRKRMDSELDSEDGEDYENQVQAKYLPSNIPAQTTSDDEDDDVDNALDYFSRLTQM